MFWANGRIDKAYRSAYALEIDNCSKIVIMSDCHRGNGGWADDFAKNKIVSLAALKHYDRERYTYIELGDGDELWKNKTFTEISSMHSDVFALLARLFREQRFYMLYGNHDIEKRYNAELINTYADRRMEKKMPLFPGIRVHTGIRLKFRRTNNEIFLIHGHQADYFNDVLWRLAQFLVRHVWKPLELIGYNNPTSAAKNNKVKEKVERRLVSWSEDKKIPLIAGHTHRPVFPKPQEGRYFNDGSCVHPWSITAIEISFGSISLVAWGQKTKDDGSVYVGKDLIAGPEKLAAYFL